MRSGDIHNHQRGGALVVCLMAATLMVTLGAGVIQLASATQKNQATSIARTRALYIAEAGLAEAYLAVAQGRSGAIGTPDEPAEYAGGVFWVEATPIDTTQVALKAHGLYGSGRFSVGATLARRVHPLGELGMAAPGDLVIGKGAVVQGVKTDSAPGGGTIASKNRRTKVSDSTRVPTAQLRTNGDIHIEALAQVTGDLRYGELGLLVASPTASVAGTMESLQREIPTLEVALPDVSHLPKKTSLPLGAHSLGSGIHALGVIEVLSGSSLTLTGPSVVVVDSLALAPGSSLLFDSLEGAVELHVVGNAEFRAGSTIDSPTGQSAAVGIFLHGLSVTTAGGTTDPSTGSEDGKGLAFGQGNGVTPPTVIPAPLHIELASDGAFHGMVYAPSVKLTLGPELVVTGAMYAGSVELAPGATFFYDESTRSSAIGVPAVPRQLAWYILPLPDEPIVQQGLDPLAYLQLQGKNTVPAALAAAEQQIALSYVNSLGELQQYSGVPTALDWSTVTGVQGVSWIDPADNLAYTYDNGIGLLEAVPDKDLDSGLLAPLGGSIRNSIQAHIAIWPQPEQGFLDSTKDKAPLTDDEIAALRGLNPPPSATFLPELEAAHIAAGGAPW